MMGCERAGLCEHPRPPARPDGSGAAPASSASQTWSPVLQSPSPVTMATAASAAERLRGTERAAHPSADGSGGRNAAAAGGSMRGRLAGGGGALEDEFGTFQAAGNRVAWDEEERDSAPPGGGGWRAFPDDDEDTNHRESLTDNCSEIVSCARGPARFPDKGQWWFGDFTEQQRQKESFTIERTSPHHKVSQQRSVKRIFETCFRTVPITVSQVEVQPLELLLCSQAENSGNDPHSSCAAHLFESLMDRKHAFDLRMKWSGSHSQTSYLTALHIDPSSVIYPGKPKTIVDSPIVAKKNEGRKMLVSSSGYDRELKLTKVTDTSVPMNGFSPSHHLQTFFQQWMQSSGKKKLKMAYDFNRSLLV